MCIWLVTSALWDEKSTESSTESIAVAQYEEWQHNKQESPGVGGGRISTVVFSLGDKLQWLHVHETWLPEDVIQAEEAKRGN